MGSTLIENNTRRVRALQADIEANLRGEYVDLAAHLSADPQWHFPRSSARHSSGSDHRGLSAVLAIFAGDVSLFYRPETLRFEYHSYTAQDNRVHSHFSMSGLTATGAEYSNDYQSLFRLEEDRVAEVWEYFDTAYLFSLFEAPG